MTRRAGSLPQHRESTRDVRHSCCRPSIGIHLSHGGESKVFDNAKDSAFDTTILAWYTDVTHEVKEITSSGPSCAVLPPD